MGKVSEQLLEAFIADLGLTPDEAAVVRAANEQEDTSEPTNEEPAQAQLDPESVDPLPPPPPRRRKSRGDGPPGQKSVNSDF